MCIVIIIFKLRYIVRYIFYISFFHIFVKNPNEVMPTNGCETRKKNIIHRILYFVNVTTVSVFHFSQKRYLIAPPGEKNLLLDLSTLLYHY